MYLGIHASGQKQNQVNIGSFGQEKSRYGWSILVVNITTDFSVLLSSTESNFRPNLGGYSVLDYWWSDHSDRLHSAESHNCQHLAISTNSGPRLILYVWPRILRCLDKVDVKKQRWYDELDTGNIHGLM
ncbi:hypothetical protein DVH24_005651 [Malus domestica]|uniref:Uncharacterized protein n=1 Tax=Malus domestica TaxID=3750 RepID=A0A498IIK4_MALDO|nr:hypothetical protein DVH24_005651 [Malus domestica]